MLSVKAHNQAMHRMPKPPLRSGFVTGDGGVMSNDEPSMTYEEFNKFCRSFTASTYVVQWGDSYVWKVGGKVFAIGGWEKESAKPAFTFKTSEQDLRWTQSVGQLDGVAKL